MNNIILCHGSFDLIHIGHIRMLRWARTLLPDARLVVSLTADAYFPAYKGDGRPAFPESVRAEWLGAIRVVDEVRIVRDLTGVPIIKELQPAIYAKGHEAEGVMMDEVNAVWEYGGRVAYMPQETPSGKQVYSSGRILSGEYWRERCKKA